MYELGTSGRISEQKRYESASCFAICSLFICNCLPHCSRTFISFVEHQSRLAMTSGTSQALLSVARACIFALENVV